MAVFNILHTHDEFFTIQFLLFFLLGFMINVFSNGQATLIFLENEYSITPDSDAYYLTDEYRIIQQYSVDVFNRNSFVQYFTLILYFGVSPLINFYYGFFVFKKGQWKDLNSLKS